MINKIKDSYIKNNDFLLLLIEGNSEVSLIQFNLI